MHAHECEQPVGGDARGERRQGAEPVVAAVQTVLSHDTSARAVLWLLWVRQHRVAGHFTRKSITFIRVLI